MIRTKIPDQKSVFGNSCRIFFKLGCTFKLATKFTYRVGPTENHLSSPGKRIYANAWNILTDAIIPALMHRIPSELRS